MLRWASGGGSAVKPVYWGGRGVTEQSAVPGGADGEAKPTGFRWGL